MPAPLSFRDCPWNNCPCEKPLELKVFSPTLCSSRLLKTGRSNDLALSCCRVSRGLYDDLMEVLQPLLPIDTLILCSCQIHLQEWATALILAKCFYCHNSPLYSVVCNIPHPSCWIFLHFFLSTRVPGFHFSFDSNLAIILLFSRIFRLLGDCKC